MRPLQVKTTALCGKDLLIQDTQDTLSQEPGHLAGVIVPGEKSRTACAAGHHRDCTQDVIVLLSMASCGA